MKKIKWVGFLSVLFFLSGFILKQEVQADSNSMSNLSIHVKLLEDGSGVVTETRDMEMHEGTELFISMENLQDSELIDFKVENFTLNDDWNTDATREEKTGRYGTIEDGANYELVWGIGDYGSNHYELSYTLTNLVRELEDGQGLLWNFNTFGDIPPEKLTMEIEGPEPFTQDEVSFWGFGLEGVIELENGHIVWESTEALSTENYATVLLQFSNAPFSTSASEDMTLSEQREMAQEGSSYNDNQGMNNKVIGWILGVIGLLGAAVIALISHVNRLYKKAGQMPSASKLKKRNKGIVYEKRPYEDGDMAEVAFLLQQIYKGSFKEYFFAYLLQWANEGRISVETETVKGKFKAKEQTTLTVLNHDKWVKLSEVSFKEYAEQVVASQGELPYELAIWKILLETADKTGVVTSSDIQSWTKKNVEEISDLDKKLNEFSLETLQRKGYIIVKEISILGFKASVQILTESGEELMDHLVQFENYLQAIDLKEAATYEQTLSWEKLLIWASLYGKGTELATDLQKFYPEVWHRFENEAPYFYHNFYGYSLFYGSWSQGLASGGYGSSGGAGGSTSIGGGGGAGGGGGGGAR
ncbi:DUF2207 domain-containing protein [Candidatus Enterococcus willemsii]|uniref:DUF2207 domain-containing protein n=1 Tax=Candidatus Enterococcus willemsii TaxID=1857215 RepID=A0ABQ6Z192_9ENTE|nr:DUF2207 domain-containing protein [Enterococcus sp. CU12B]KAF1305017.1 hypothetical protein BAU17_12910 [Enterococcus sp. CU12B]